MAVFRRTDFFPSGFSPFCCIPLLLSCGVDLVGPMSSSVGRAGIERGTLLSSSWDVDDCNFKIEHLDINSKIQQKFFLIEKYKLVKFAK